MSGIERNRLRELRERRNLSQQALAAAAGLTRQSVGAIEAGRATPAVDVALRLARALACRVEDLFELGEPDTRVHVEPTAPTHTGRVALAQLGGRWVSYPLASDGLRISADGLATSPHHVDLVRSPDDARDNIVVMGCAAALGLVVDRLGARGGAGRFLWLSRSSTAALEALAADRTHVAGVHLVDGPTGEANVPDVRRHLRTGAIVLIQLARWEVGLVLAAGNPKKVRRVGDLSRRGLRLVTREPGAGARRLLERELARAGLPASIAATGSLAAGHLEVAQTIAGGAADVGVATRDAAIACDLAFVPLAEERYDLAIPRATLDDPRIQRLLETMTSAACRRELSSLGYDVRSCGDRVAEVLAA